MTREPRVVLARATTPAYIYEPPNEWHAGLLREHIVREPESWDGDDGPVTVCGITYMSLPDNAPPTVESDGTLSYDKPWYYDHDVDITFDCRSCQRLYKEGN